MGMASSCNHLAIKHAPALSTTSATLRVKKYMKSSSSAAVVNASSFSPKRFEDLLHRDVLRFSTQKNRVHFIDTFKNLNQQDRFDLCNKALDACGDLHISHMRLEGLLYPLASSFILESDGASALYFLNQLVKLRPENSMMKEIVTTLLDMNYEHDRSLSKNWKTNHVSLVLVAELGVLWNQDKQNLNMSKMSHNFRNMDSMDDVSEHISSNLISRSNINSSAVRLALVHYLICSPPVTVEKWSLNRTISRFGQSLLDELFQYCFEKNNKSKAAFSFLTAHFLALLTNDTQVFEICFSALKRCLLKHPEQFPKFIQKFTDQMEFHEQSQSFIYKECLENLLKIALQFNNKNILKALEKSMKLIKENPVQKYDNVIPLRNNDNNQKTWHFQCLWNFL